MSNADNESIRRTCFELRAALESMGWQQVRLAQLCGVKEVQVWRWCEGKAPIPRYVWTILTLAEWVKGMDEPLEDDMKWEVEKRHVYRNRKDFKDLAKRFHPDVSMRDTTAEMQIINRYRPQKR
jgi:hypothetical protein